MPLAVTQEDFTFFVYVTISPSRSFMNMALGSQINLTVLFSDVLRFPTKLGKMFFFSWMDFYVPEASPLDGYFFGKSTNTVGLPSGKNLGSTTKYLHIITDRVPSTRREVMLSVCPHPGGVGGIARSR